MGNPSLFNVLEIFDQTPVHTSCAVHRALLANLLVFEWRFRRQLVIQNAVRVPQILFPWITRQ